MASANHRRPGSVNRRPPGLGTGPARWAGAPARATIGAVSSPRVTLVLGGSRSGKSALAERLALAAGDPSGTVWYLATGVATDPDMAQRIDAHRAGRPARFRTVECGAALPDALTAALTDPDDPTAPALVDALGTWVAAAEGLAPDADGLLASLRARRAAGAPTVLVSDEVGMGVHPPTAVGRRFRDALGEVNTAVAAEADVALLVVAGRVLRLDRVEDVVAALAEDDSAGEGASIHRAAP